MKKTPLIIAGFALALTACGSSHPAAVHTPVPVATTYSAPPPAPAYTPPPDNPLQDWWNNTGSTDWTTVYNDLLQVQADANNGDAASVMSDGAQLRTDALAAAKDHPAWAYDKHAYYFGTMGALAFAGLELQFGNTGKATSFLQTATSDATKFEAEAQAEGVTISTSGF